MLIDEDETEDSFVYIFDQRTKNTSCKKLGIGGIFSFLEFFNKLIKEFPYRKGESFVITTTNRIVIHDNDAFLSMIESGDTLYILKDANQKLVSAVYEKIDFQPHYDTLIKSGVYEYYASEGSINPLPFAFAELIDNALAATAKNHGNRNIDLKLYFDDGQYVMSIQDNGVGMSPRQLNNWAVYRLSKFNRKDRHKVKEESSDENYDKNDISKSLNSDISWFGVGGKQAIFFIGGAVRVITRSIGECDVHEFVLSKDDFRQKEANKEKIYSGYIKNRPPADNKHVENKEKITKMLISNEKHLPERTGFTNIVISSLDSQHISYIKNGFDKWTRQLAHIYHYYIHGNEGNTVMSKERQNVGAIDVNITVALYENGQRKEFVSLNEIENDQETMFIRTACDTFEFNVEAPEQGSKIEGIMRYHPFLYDKETFPIVDNTVHDKDEEDSDSDDDTAPEENILQTRGTKPIFECFWNGRLIPYTFVQDFDWCKTPRKRGALPTECYQRISGCLFTNDKYKVSTNKLTFIDLDTKLKDPNVTFSRVILGEKQPGNVQRQFFDWLRECHEKYDKQIKFLNYIDQILYSARNTKMLWTSYSTIEWEGKIFKAGQLIRTTKTMPVMCGKIQRFLLLGQHEGDTYAVGGEVEIVRHPLELYGETVNFSLTKLDRNATKAQVQNQIKNESSNVPGEIVVSWPNKEIEDGGKIPLGSNIGEMKCKIISNRGEAIDKLITSSGPRKLIVEQKLYLLSAKGLAKRSTKPREITSHVSSYPYTFKSVQNIQTMGNYLIDLQVLFASTGNSILSDGKELPSLTIHFSVTEAPPFKFTVGILESPLCIGEPFDIPLDLQDKQNNPAKAIDCGEPVLKSSGLNISYDDYVVKENSIILQGVVALGEVTSQSGQNFSMTATLPDLKQKVQTMKVRLLPGSAKKILVQGVTYDDLDAEKDDNGCYSISNHCKLIMELVLVDVFGNNTTTTGKTKFQAKFGGNLGISTFLCDKKSSASNANLSGKINIKKFKEETAIKAKIVAVGNKDIEPLEVTFLVKPSTDPHSIVVYYQDPYSEEEVNMKLKTGQEIYWHAGETISNLTFEMFDEANEVVQITDEIVEKIKLNWVGDSELEELNLNQGELPDVTVPLNTNDSKFCMIGFSGSKSAQFSFYVKPVAGEPQSLKCDLVGNRQVIIGVARKSLIKVAICDKHHNELAFRSDQINCVQIHADGLDESIITKSVEKNHIIIGNIQFNEGPLGSKEVAIEYKGNEVELEDHLLVQLVAGSPVMMEVLGWPSFSQALITASGSKVSENIQIQLLDGWGNKSNEPGVRVVMSKDSGIKISPSLGPVLTNEDGFAKFSKFTVTAKKGEYCIQPRAVFNRVSIEGPKLKISVLPNTETPISFKIQYDTDVRTLITGTLWPEFKVKVLSDEGECVTSEIHLCMCIWKSSSKKERAVPSNAVTRRVHLKEPDIAIFKDMHVAKIPGTYAVCFKVTDSATSHAAIIRSETIKFSVAAGIPHSLVPIGNPGTPTVSNAKPIANRTLLRNLKLKLVDEYGNNCSVSYNGNVKLYIELAEESLKSNVIPQFEGKCKFLNAPLKNNQVVLQNICLKENCPGIDNSEYMLRCEVTCSTFPEPVEPYTIGFMFYNDINKQQQMSALSKQSEALKKDIESYESLFSLHETLISEMHKQKEELDERKEEIIKDLKECQLSFSGELSTDMIDDMIALSKEQQKNLSSKPRRKCKLKEYPGKSADIVGKIGHLALVEDDDAAKVLSWHMMGDFDCLVTMTTKKAREVYNCTGGMQQVLPFDSIYKKNLDDNRPLPHQRVSGKSFKPKGNPIFARDVLFFPKHAETCKVVFGMLIGDTIIMNDLVSANEYRKEVVKYTYCPTILTRNGERIRSNGKFGGNQNKISSIEQLKGSVFGAPLGEQHQNYVTQESLLNDLKSLLEEYDETCSELKSQQTAMQTKEMILKKQEHVEAVQKLKELENKLGITPNKPKSNNKHTLKSKGESPAPRKRARLK